MSPHLLTQCEPSVDEERERGSNCSQDFDPNNCSAPHASQSMILYSLRLQSFLTLALLILIMCSFRMERNGLSDPCLSVASVPDEGSDSSLSPFNPFHPPPKTLCVYTALIRSQCTVSTLLSSWCMSALLAPTHSPFPSLHVMCLCCW